MCSGADLAIGGAKKRMYESEGMIRVDIGLDRVNVLEI